MPYESHLCQQENLYFDLLFVCVFTFNRSQNRRDKKQIEMSTEYHYKAKLMIEIMKNLIEKVPIDRSELMQRYLDDFRKNPKIEILNPLFKEYPVCRSAIMCLNYEFDSWKISYKKMVKQYPHYESVDITNFLIGFQKKIKFDFKQFQEETKKDGRYSKPDNTYTTQINMSRKDTKWTTEFIQKWREIKTNYDKERAQLKAKQKPISEGQGKEKEKQPSFQSLKGPIPIPTQSQEVAAKQPSRAVQTSRQMQKLPSGSQGQPIQSVKNKPGPKPKKCRMESQEENDSSDNVKLVKPNTSRKEPQKLLSEMEMQTQKKHQIPEQTNRVNSLISYLNSRKNLSINPANTRKIAEFLNEKLEMFMNTFLEKAIDMAKLRNYNYSLPGAGDQFKHFSKENKSLQCTGITKVPKADIFRITFPSKLELFADIRIKEEEHQENLRMDLQKKHQLAKKRDSKIMDYLLASREGFSQEWKVRGETQTDRLVISNNHVQFVLEGYPIFKDGIAMFKSYHY